MTPGVGGLGKGMGKQKPQAQVRPGGGFNQGFGDSNEHLDEAAAQQAVKQKQLSQQVANNQQALSQGQGGNKAVQDLQQAEATGQLPGMDGQDGQQPQPQAQAKPPRALGSIKEELLVRPAQDIVEGLKSFFDLNALMGINPQADTPEDQAKKKQMHQRFQQLTQEEQQVAQQRYQEEMERKKQEEEEKQARKQQEEDAKRQSIQAPSSPKKGPKGPSGSKKQKAEMKLEQDRKSLSGPSGSN